MLQAAPWDTRSVTSQLVALVTYVKYLDFDLTINILNLKADMWSSAESSGTSLEVCKLVSTKNFSKDSVSINQKTRSNICFQTLDWAFEALTKIKN